MKRILISLLLACVALNCTAQNELQKCIDNLPSAHWVGNVSEQNHDRLDSLNYLNIMIYELPYVSKCDRDFADAFIRGVVQAFNKDLPYYAGGFCYANQLRENNPIESRKTKMYYGENLNPFVVGGVGRNYATLRITSRQNPNYRTAYGLEWWLTQRATTVLRIQSFRLFGPLTADLYQNALRQAGIVKEENSNIVIETSHSTSNRKEILEAIKMLKGMYEASEKGMSDSFKRAIVSAINERIKAYLLPQDATIEEKIELFRTLSDIPGYQARVSTVDGNHWKCHTFGWLADIYPQLNVSCITWAEPGNPECVTPGLGGESQPLNFLYKVIVNNKDLEGIK